MYIFAGSASRSLGEKTASKLGAKLGSVNTSYFENGELRVVINEPKVNKQSVIIQSFSDPVDTSIMEFCFMADAIKRLGCHDITAIVPWLGYSKQDKVFQNGEALSAKVIAKMLQVTPVKQIITFDLHNPAILGFFDIPVTNISARELLSEYYKKKLTKNTVVVAPDAGAIKSSTAFAGELDVPVVYMDKKRDLSTGKVKVLGISRPVSGKEVIIVDDMIVTGGTLVQTAKYLKKSKVRSLSVAATHHLYVKGAQKSIEKAGFDEVVVTDTIEKKTKPSASNRRLKVLSVSDLIVEAINSQMD
ncbi:ribose-phosphate diphosphokinase [Patescibacteria group bacterium]